MLVKLIYFGEGVTIPSTSIGLGLGLVSVWIDHSGYTSASNNIGATGYLYLNAPEVDIGEPDAATAQIFSDLTNRIVHFEITPNLFVLDGGIAVVKMAVHVQEHGSLVERAIQFQVSDCQGVSAVSGTISFSTGMSALPVTVAQVEHDAMVTDEEMSALQWGIPA